MTTNSPRPLRLTPPQLEVIRRMQEGWVCEGVGNPESHPWQNLVWYPFRREDKFWYAQGNTLASLERKGLITHVAALITFAYDGRQHPGSRLVLTPAGQAAPTT